ncbi:MAG: TonB family protein [Nitrospirae bacterium]|nr:TonB family protein [Nitrospirota bacterium]
MNKKENALLYLLVFTSLLLHLVAVLVIPAERFEAKKGKEPIEVDLFDKVRLGAENKFPAPEDRAKIASRPAAPAVPERLAKAPSFRPSVPSIPLPVGPPARGGSPAPPLIPGWQTGTKDGTSAPSVRSVPTLPAESPADKPAGAEQKEKPRKLKLPTLKDIERYAKTESFEIRPGGKDEVTLDTRSLQVFSYCEQIFKRYFLRAAKNPDVMNIKLFYSNTRIKLTILNSGRLEKIEVLKSSGDPALDETLKDAFIKAAPYNAFPKSWDFPKFILIIDYAISREGHSIYLDEIENLYYPGEQPLKFEMIE